MSQICSGCYEYISDFPFLVCSKSYCNKVYDLKCLGLSVEEFENCTQEYKQHWICPECISSQRKPNRNAETPVNRMSGQTSTYKISSCSNVNTQRGIRIKNPESPIIQNKCMLDELKEFRSEVFKRLDSQERHMKNILESNICKNKELQELREYVRVLVDKISHVTSLEKQVVELTNRNKDLESKILNISSETAKKSSQSAQVISTMLTDSAGSKPTDRASAVKQSGAMKTASLSVRQETSQTRTPRTDHGADNKPEAEEQHKDKWTTVIKKKEKFQNKEVKRGLNSSLIEIQAMERKKHLHVWRLHPGTTIEVLTNHVKKICGPKVDFKIEKIKHKTERDYASFIIGVNEQAYNELCVPNVWPLNAEFAEWIWFRRTTKNRNGGT